MAGQNSPLIFLSGISKNFPGVQALKRVDLHLKKGEVLGLVGENGAGKSTLMKILAGVHQKNEGQIFFRGNEIQFKNPHEAIKAGVSTVYQDLNLVEELSICENIFLGRFIKSRLGLIDQKGMEKIAREILGKLGLDIDPCIPVFRLGVAQKQMVEIAKALAIEAEVLILDEPSATLSERELDNLFQVIRELKKEGMGIIYISHQLEEIFQITDRVQVLRDGEAVGEKETAETSREELITLIIGRELKDFYPEEQPHRKGQEILCVEELQGEGREASFELREGEILGFVGLVGSGRTELMRVLFGADRKKKGKVFLRGEEVRVDSPQKAVKLGFGYLPEERKTQALLLERSVKENMSLASLPNYSLPLGIIKRKKEEEDTLGFLRRLQIKIPGLWTETKNLSGGNQQKVILARWLLSDARVIIFDEPTRGIDVGTKSEIYRLLQEMKENNIGVILVSSDLEEVVHVCDRVIVMDRGELVKVLEGKDKRPEMIMHYATGGE
ncbi:MAG: sugar ABC transporter ATP-binding protein [Candidatus Aminicenantes bacterium]|nr:sugar ABC transporter ATP-binding protein [Candidatus Aminicenantes bacterium]